MTVLRFTIGANPPPRLDKALARDAPESASLSRTRLARLIEAGAVSVGGETRINPKSRVAEYAEIEIDLPEPRSSDTLPEAIALDILYEDSDVIVVNKPAGLVVHPAPGTPGGTLVNALLHHCGETLSGIGGTRRPGIVHRIDKDTSGVLVVAKHDAAHHGLALQFERHSAERRYQAVVHGVPDPADPRLLGRRGVGSEPGGIIRIATHLARHRTDRQKQAVYFETGRHAVTRLRVVERYGTPAVAALVECWLETGRTHQIRVHMAYAGHGLIGDAVYCGHRKLSPAALSFDAAQFAAGFPRQALHAAELGFAHPRSGEWMRFTAPMPPDMTTLVERLRRG